MCIKYGQYPYNQKTKCLQLLQKLLLALVIQEYTSLITVANTRVLNVTKLKNVVCVKRLLILNLTMLNEVKISAGC